MCDIHETYRAFILRPHKIYRKGDLLSTAAELENIQEKYHGRLDIFFIKAFEEEQFESGFVVCMPADFSTEEFAEVTAHLCAFLDIPPRLLAQTGLSSLI